MRANNGRSYSHRLLMRRFLGPDPHDNFVKTLLQGVPVLPGLIALDLGVNAEVKAELIVNRLTTKIEAAGLALTIELGAEIEVLLTEALALSLEIDACIEFVVVQLKVVVVVAVGGTDLSASSTNLPTAATSRISGVKTHTATQAVQSTALSSNVAKQPTVSTRTAYSGAADHYFHGFYQVANRYDPPYDHLCSSTHRFPCSSRQSSQSIRLPPPPPLVERSLLLLLPSKAIPLLAPVRLPGLGSPLMSPCSRRRHHARRCPRSNCRPDFGRDVELTADLIAKIVLEIEKGGYSSNTHSSTELSAIIGAIASDASWLQLNASTELNAELIAKIVRQVKTVIQKSGYYKSSYSGTELSGLIANIFADAGVDLGLNTKMAGLSVGVEAALKAGSFFVFIPQSLSLLLSVVDRRVEFDPGIVVDVDGTRLLAIGLNKMSCGTSFSMGSVLDLRQSYGGSYHMGCCPLLSHQERAAMGGHVFGFSRSTYHQCTTITFKNRGFNTSTGTS
ncbi:hypothetical protein FN846DRAFT_887817 [Sphaerosporella brunnea]|uniref:Uncharacterized protein n=1 Tax=Sphaerosporella brunnea TaxID=1250544 RepID=A0A5J5F493_9PEZI|nr:hypothetical protein FN846DRAFT_887817 [Sphaerosporella brunnea]